jgi:hypothetical protein
MYAQLVSSRLNERGDWNKRSGCQTEKLELAGKKELKAMVISQVRMAKPAPTAHCVLAVRLRRTHVVIPANTRAIRGRKSKAFSVVHLSRFGA